MKKLLLKRIICIVIILGCWSIKANAQYTKLLDFTGTINGSNPCGDLISDGTFLYGMTYNGGTNNFGVIFKIKPDGTNYAKLHNFSGDTADGSHPNGSLVSDGTFLYGMTPNGGSQGYGIIFKIMPDGTGFTKIMDFTGATNGKYPMGSLYYDSTFLYGMTLQGGTQNNGTIFKIMPDGTGYTKLHDFSGGYTDGSWPYGSVVSDGTFLYGMTYDGGIEDGGVLFKIMSDGTGYTKLLEFYGHNSSSGSDGSGPMGTLFLSGPFLYGMTKAGGVNNAGIIFIIKPDGTGYYKLHDFSESNGSYPYGSLVFDGTYFYGLTIGGGVNDLGTIFKIKFDGSNFFKIYDFMGPGDGSHPKSSLFYDGTFLCGMTEEGGTINKGTIFKYALTTEIKESNPVNNFNVYPNPVTDNLIVVTPQNAKIELFNIKGQLIKTLAAGGDKISIDVSALPGGVYIVKVIPIAPIGTDKGFEIRKFLKE